MNLKRVIIILVLFFSIAAISPFYAGAAQSKGTHQAKTEHKTGHSDSKKAEHAGGITFWYFIYWAGLLGILAMSGKFLAEAANKGLTGVAVADNDLLIALKLVLLGFFIYFIDQTAAMKHYHEPALIGLIRFALKITAGIAMMIYSFSGLSEHEHH